MKIKIIIFFSLILFSGSFSQITIPSYLKADNSLTDSVYSIVKELGLDKDFNVGEDGTEQISLAVIDLNNEIPLFGGYKPDNLIYPASVYKMYVAASVLIDVQNGRYGLYDKVAVKPHNAVDRSAELGFDKRPVLKPDDTVTVWYLLDLMITRSDNSAANCLIDLTGRPAINKMISDNGWNGSEVTRKFLKRKFEDPGYENVPGTMTSALHAADFLYKIYTDNLYSFFVSRMMKTLLCGQLDKSKIASGLTEGTIYCNKTGWFSFWTNDVGIVENGKIKYIIACFLPLREEEALPLMKSLSEKIFALVDRRASPKK